MLQLVQMEIISNTLYTLKSVAQHHILCSDQVKSSANKYVDVKIVLVLEQM